MVVSIWWEMEGFNELARKIELADAALHHRRKPHQKSRDYMKKRWRVNFNSDGSIYGAWRPLSAWSIILRGPHKTLRYSGALQSGFFAQADSPQISDVQTLWVFQRNPIYLFAQHFGNANKTSFARMMGFGPVPARKLWGINGEDEEQIKEIFDDFCQDIIAKYLG